MGVSSTADAPNATALAGARARIAAARQGEEASYGRFGPALAQVTQAATAVLGWRNIYVPSEVGSVIPVTYGFSWICPAPISSDWSYILFEWDNILASYMGGVLGFREAAYSNLIQLVKSKSSGGFLPNWAAGGSKAAQSEPAVGARVLLDLHARYGDAWLVELLFEDLLDHSQWQWEERRVRVPGSACCDEPGFITLGGPRAPGSAACATAAECVGSFRGESGLDQSPLWDCPGAAPDGSGGDCSSLWSAALQPHLLQIGDAQSTALFVADARALAALADVLGGAARAAAAALLRARADAMAAQLARLWDPAQGAFVNIATATGAHWQKVAPTSFYPLLARAASPAQAQELVQRHLLNASRFCVSAAWAAENPESCYWGLPSISRDDAAFMQPQGYVYWRGETWGPMALLVWWSLEAYRGVSPVVDGARAALAAQKGAQVVDVWQRHRHVCENASPFAPGSALPPGTGTGGLNKSNGECTGWEFYTWGALGGLLEILEVLGPQAHV